MQANRCPPSVPWGAAVPHGDLLQMVVYSPDKKKYKNKIKLMNYTNI